MIHSDNIPEPLRGARRWVVFRCTPQPDGSVKKIPLTVRGTLARCDNPIDWATLPEVLTAIEFCIGTHPAFVLGEDYPLRVLDLDHCINRRREPNPAGSADRQPMRREHTSKSLYPVTVCIS